MKIVYSPLIRKGKKVGPSESDAATDAWNLDAYAATEKELDYEAMFWADCRLPAVQWVPIRNDDHLVYSLSTSTKYGKRRTQTTWVEASPYCLDQSKLNLGVTLKTVNLKKPETSRVRITSISYLNVYECVQDVNPLLSGIIDTSALRSVLKSQSSEFNLVKSLEFAKNARYEKCLELAKCIEYLRAAERVKSVESPKSAEFEKSIERAKSAALTKSVERAKTVAFTKSVERAKNLAFTKSAEFARNDELAKSVERARKFVTTTSSEYADRAERARKVLEGVSSGRVMAGVARHNLAKAKSNK